MVAIKCEWMLCPICGNKTRNKIRKDTVLRNYPLYCPKCKQESLVEVKDLQIIVIKEPDGFRRRADEFVNITEHRLFL
ncbi:MAG: cysteine-rich KTR domain-containing protein [Mediterraneibacter gnavus]